MDKSYEPSQIEQHWYKYWEEGGYFAPRSGKQTYSMVLPPPNVTGSLHMGHGFQHTLMDVLVRWRRMCGDEVLWQCGTDHAGIATQILVERTLEAEGTSRLEIGREAFLKRVWQWKEESGGNITRQMRRLGVSPDWSRARFTMDDRFSAVVCKIFTHWYDAGLIYRGKRLVNWDPTLKTALSDLEVEAQEEQGNLWHLRYPLQDGQQHLIVATTRPETLLGDMAVAVHPEDERYRKLVGNSVALPLCDRKIPVIADAHVDPKFGTGCVKITPAHDFNDYQMASRHDLPLLNIFNDDASLNDEVPEPYRGMDRFKARKRIVSDLDALGLLEKIEKHRLKIPRGDRSGAVLEPRLTNQWYVAADQLAPAAIQAVETGDTRFVPDGWKNTYFAWLRNIQSWCISRQLWWGHRIPAWYDDTGAVYVGADEACVRAKYDIAASTPLRRDPDVLDTWFSSALWTFGTLGWEEDEKCFKRFHPTNVLITGFDIIFFWVARMMMSTLYFTDEVPFKDVYITGLVLDAHGKKMSKSKGNILDPIDLIDGIRLDDLVDKRTTGLMRPQDSKRILEATRKEFPKGIDTFGADALRFTFCALASTARDIRFDMGRVLGYKNFCNKLWNAARYVFQQTEGFKSAPNDPNNIFDVWIISKLQRCQLEMDIHLKQYRFDLAATCLHHFIWHSYCDWYLEISKCVLNNADLHAEAANMRHTLLSVLEQLLRMTHPLMPFITEEIWQHARKRLDIKTKSIMVSSYPQGETQHINEAAEERVEQLIALINSVRMIRGEFNLPYACKLKLLLRATDKVRHAPAWKALTKEHSVVLTSLAGLESIEWLEGDAPASATQIVLGVEVLVPIAGLIDKDKEIDRLDKEIDRLVKDMATCQHKLGKSDFVDKAPPQVVADIKARYADTQNTHQRLKQQRALIVSIDK